MTSTPRSLAHPAAAMLAPLHKSPMMPMTAESPASCLTALYASTSMQRVSMQ